MKPIQKKLNLAVAVGALLNSGLAGAMAHKAPPPAPNPDVAPIQQESTLGPVAHTAARDQGDTGFCWAYTYSGLIEGEAKKTGKNVTISPEYLALNHLPKMTEQLLPLFDSADLLPGALGWILKRFVRGIFDPEGAISLSEPLEDLDNIGVMPETAFSYKFPLDKDANGRPKEIHPTLQEKLQKFASDNFFDHKKVAYYQNNPDALRDDMMTSLGIAVPKPTDSFDYRGRQYTPQTFLSEYLKFKTDEYEEVIIAEKSDQKRELSDREVLSNASQESAFQTIRNAMADGYAVPVGFLIFEDQKQAEKSGVFTAQNCVNEQCQKVLGGHAVLGIGMKQDAAGTPNAMLIKNSWGSVGLDEQGHPTDVQSESGFFIIDSSYLSQARKAPTGWSFVVPKKYASGL